MCRGPQHAALTQEAGEIDGAIDSALASVEENKDKVKRKGLIFDSRDNEYDAAVTTWVASPKAASGESSKKRVKFGNRAK